MESLSPQTFNFQFRNLLEAPGRNSTFICFRVEKWQHGSFRHSYEGVFRNQFYPETLHAELRFLNWFCGTILSPYADYHVTWFTSWSPCAHCAEEVADFLWENENVSLTIHAARLYYYWDYEDQQGLRDLWHAGAQVAVMSPEDFKYCWDNFVDNGGMCFRYWKGVRWNFYILEEELNEILWG